MAATETIASDLVGRLARHKTLAAAPLEELAWIAARGYLVTLREGEVLLVNGAPIDTMWIVLSGRIALVVDRGAGPINIAEAGEGEIAGRLPYSRAVTAPGATIAIEAAEIMSVDRRHLPALILECPALTTVLVGAMVDRARLQHATDLREAKMAAEKATRAKSEFLARMSHEIRTPLNAVIGMADVLACGPLSPHQRKCVEVSQRNGIALLNLINDILDLAKVESGKVELEAIGFDLRAVVAGVAEVVETKASAKGLWLRQTIHPAVPVYLIGDPNRLRQVLINLLGNSIKFTERGGLEIRVDPDPENKAPGRLRFAVADTGIGIEADKVNAVFESFTQADASTTRKYGGTGLGLTISKQLVELMGGRLWLESTLGVGSTFFFTVQLLVEESQTERTEEKSQTSLNEQERRIAGMRILLADDSDDNRFLVAAYLKGIECSIDTAENGAEAIELFRKSRYDVVLMDGEMPLMDGYTATREIRRLENENRLPTGSGTPILAFTAHAFADMAAKAFEAGFTDLLTKPLRRTTLLEALAKYGKEPLGYTVEPDLRDVVPGYLKKRRADVVSCCDALAAGDLASIQAIAHKMKGTGAGYGFPFLTEIGGKIETAARQGQTDEVKSGIDALARWLDRLYIEPEG
jgi:signal transduction histidine kinase/CheY-like chemotaxis protein